jgi:ribonucleoside-triphosphate reductase
MGEANSAYMRQIAIDDYLSETTKRNHLENRVYVHDLDYYAVGAHNCLSIPFDKLLANGFNTRQTDIRPAGSINTAFQLVAVIFQIQSLQ